MTGPVFHEFPFNVEAGDPFRVFDLVYYFDRVDEDGVATLRSSRKTGAGDFMVTDDDGMPRKPNVDEFMQLMSSGDIVPLERRPQNVEARVRRRADIDSEQARELDEVCDFRIHVARRIEEKRRAGTQSLSDQALKPLVNEVWKHFKNERRKLKKVLKEEKRKTGRKLKPAGNRWKVPKRKPTGSTVRSWYHTRGQSNSRKVSDGVSRTGRAVRARMIDHPIEILACYATRAVMSRGGTRQQIRNYRAELKLIGEGRAFHRVLAEVDDDGNWRIGDQPADYPIPDRPYTPVSDSVFYDLVKTMRSKKAYAIQTSAKGAMQRYEGGGRTEVPSRIGMLGEIDDTPVPNLFLMDSVTGLPLGGATATVLIDVCSRLAMGADLSWEKANTNTVLRTILDANRPKTILPRMVDALPKESAYLLKFAAGWAAKFDRILGDNLTAYHGIEVEEACMDVGTVTEFTGKNKPRAKPHIENLLGVLQRLLFKRLPDARWDVALAERFGFEPDKHIMCTLQEARELFQIAITIYNCTRHSGLDKKQPALVRKEHGERYRVNLITDQQRLHRAMMRTEKSAEFGADGLVAFGRRYSEAAVTAKIYQDHENAPRQRAQHLGPKQKKRRNTDHKQRPTYTIRYKYDEDDLGSVYVWNPHHLPAGEWVEVPCTDREMKGRSKALHDLRLELFDEAADDFLDRCTEDILHAYLSSEISNITEASSERDKVRHAKIMDTPQAKAALKNFVTVEDETSLTPTEQRQIEQNTAQWRNRDDAARGPAVNVASAGLSAYHRKDGHTHSPRPDPYRRNQQKAFNTPSKRAQRTEADKVDKAKSQRTRRRRSGNLGWDDVA